MFSGGEHPKVVVGQTYLLADGQGLCDNAGYVPQVPQEIKGRETFGANPNKIRVFCSE